MSSLSNTGIVLNAAHVLKCAFSFTFSKLGYTAEKDDNIKKYYNNSFCACIVAYTIVYTVQCTIHKNTIHAINEIADEIYWITFVACSLQTWKFDKSISEVKSFIYMYVTICGKRKSYSQIALRFVIHMTS